MGATGPLRVPVAELRRRTGSRRVLQRSVPITLVGEMTGVAGTAVPDDGELELDLVIESVLEGVTVTGHVRAPWTADCRRCLEPVTGAVDVEVQEVFEATPVPDETYPIEGDHIDLRQMLRDTVLLALPLSVLCREECVGPDPERFPATVEASVDAVDEAVDEPPGDPRWSALGDLRFDE